MQEALTPITQGRVSLAPVHTWQELSSDGHTRYKISLFSDGHWTCECKGFNYKGFCRHIGKVRSSFLYV